MHDRAITGGKQESIVSVHPEKKQSLLCSVKPFDANPDLSLPYDFKFESNVTDGSDLIWKNRICRQIQRMYESHLFSNHSLQKQMRPFMIISSSIQMSEMETMSHWHSSHSLIVKSMTKSRLPKNQRDQENMEYMPQKLLHAPLFCNNSIKIV
jgi:hypothetical protein